MSNTVSKIAITRAIALLLAAKAKYAIVTEDGEKLGDLEVIERKPKKETKKRNFTAGYLGAYSDHFEPYLANLMPGEVRTIPVRHGPNKVSEGGTFDTNKLRNTISAWCRYRFGKDACITAVSTDGQSIEVMRAE